MATAEQAGSDNQSRQLMPKRYLFSVEMVERAEAPAGEEDREWYRYVLVSECTRVTGLCAGSDEEVRAHAQEVADQLNSRNGSAPGGWTSRQMHA